MTRVELGLNPFPVPVQMTRLKLLVVFALLALAAPQRCPDFIPAVAPPALPGYSCLLSPTDGTKCFTISLACPPPSTPAALTSRAEWELAVRLSTDWWAAPPRFRRAQPPQTSTLFDDIVLLDDDPSSSRANLTEILSDDGGAEFGGAFTVAPVPRVLLAPVNGTGEGWLNGASPAWLLGAGRSSVSAPAFPRSLYKPPPYPPGCAGLTSSPLAGAGAPIDRLRGAGWVFSTRLECGDAPTLCVVRPPPSPSVVPSPPMQRNSRPYWPSASVTVSAPSLFPPLQTLPIPLLSLHPEDDDTPGTPAGTLRVTLDTPHPLLTVDADQGVLLATSHDLGAVGTTLVVRVTATDSLGCGTVVPLKVTVVVARGVPLGLGGCMEQVPISSPPFVTAWMLAFGRCFGGPDSYDPPPPNATAVCAQQLVPSARLIARSDSEAPLDPSRGVFKFWGLAYRQLCLSASLFFQPGDSFCCAWDPPLLEVAANHPPFWHPAPPPPTREYVTRVIGYAGDFREDVMWGFFAYNNETLKWPPAVVASTLTLGVPGGAWDGRRPLLHNSSMLAGDPDDVYLRNILPWHPALTRSVVRVPAPAATTTPRLEVAPLLVYTDTKEGVGWSGPIDYLLSLNISRVGGMLGGAQDSLSTTAVLRVCDGLDACTSGGEGEPGGDAGWAHTPDLTLHLLVLYCDAPCGARQIELAPCVDVWTSVNGVPLPLNAPPPSNRICVPGVGGGGFPYARAVDVPLSPSPTGGAVLFVVLVVVSVSLCAALAWRKWGRVRQAWHPPPHKLVGVEDEADELVINPLQGGERPSPQSPATTPPLLRRVTILAAMCDAVVTACTVYLLVALVPATAPVSLDWPGDAVMLRPPGTAWADPALPPYPPSAGGVVWPPPPSAPRLWWLAVVALALAPLLRAAALGVWLRSLTRVARRTCKEFSLKPAPVPAHPLLRAARDSSWLVAALVTLPSVLLSPPVAARLHAETWVQDGYPPASPVGRAMAGWDLFWAPAWVLLCEAPTVIAAVVSLSLLNLVTPYGVASPPGALLVLGLTGMAACYIVAAVPWPTVRAVCVVLRVLLVGQGSMPQHEAAAIVNRVAHGRHHKVFAAAESVCCARGCLWRLQLGLGIAQLAGAAAEDPNFKGEGGEEEDEVPVAARLPAPVAVSVVTRLARVRMLAAVGEEVAPPGLLDGQDDEPMFPGVVVVGREEPKVDPPVADSPPGAAVWRDDEAHTAGVDDQIKVALDY